MDTSVTGPATGSSSGQPQTLAPPPPLLPVQPQFKNPQQAIYAALLGAFINAAVPAVERAIPGPNAGPARFATVRDAADDFIRSAAPLAEFIPHTNPYTAFLTSLLVQQAYEHALQSGQVSSGPSQGSGAAVTAATAAQAPEVKA